MVDRSVFRSTFQDNQDEGNGMTYALETTRLSKRYGRSAGLQDCSLALPTGRVAAVVGPNGAGKTTFLHLVAGLLQPTTGTVHVFDRQSRDALPRIGFVAQDHPLYRDFSVNDHLRLGQNYLAGPRPWLRL